MYYNKLYFTALVKLYINVYIYCIVDQINTAEILRSLTDPIF